MVASSTGASMPVSSNSAVPADGIQGLKDNWKGDLVAGLLVSLIALPLCLGIAMASGFPAFGGVITAIIGGLLVGPLSGTPLTIKGPAAGLIAIVIASVEALGAGNNLDGYRFTLAAIVVASAIQVFFALCKLGRFADFFPTSVVHGMLASIGIIIMSKQIHPLLGVKPIAREPLPLLLEVPHSLVVMNPEIALVGITSVLIVLFAVNIFGRAAKFFPGPLVAVCAGIAFCLYFDFSHAHKYEWLSVDYTVDERYLVSLPESFFAGITFPDFSKVFSLISIEFIMLFAVIGSLESLLTCKAVNALDPWKRKSRLDQDLMAVGSGNLLCGLIGGLPMIAEVVRSSANIHYGAKTRWGNFFHGTFLLFFVAGALGVPLGSMLSKFPSGETRADGRFHVALPIACTFGNVLSFKRAFQKAQGQPISLDFSKTEYVDHTFMHEVRSLEREHDIVVTGLDRLTPITSHPQAMRRMISARAGRAAVAI